MTYERVFDIIARGKRHAMVTPVQVDRFGQMNISLVGDYDRPKTALLGVRGYPGNTILNSNSMFVPSHDTRTFVEGEVDIYRDSPLRYLGYANECGEAFRPLVPVELVRNAQTFTCGCVPDPAAPERGGLVRWPMANVPWRR